MPKFKKSDGYTMNRGNSGVKFKDLGSSPFEHTGDGNHPDHHKDDYFEGTSRKVIDYAEDYYRQRIQPVMKDPIGSYVEGGKTAWDLISRPGGGWRALEKLKEHFKLD
jgi:hypothetical protein